MSVTQFCPLHVSEFKRLYSGATEAVHMLLDGTDREDVLGWVLEMRRDAVRLKDEVAYIHGHEIMTHVEENLTRLAGDIGALDGSGRITPAQAGALMVHVFSMLRVDGS